MSELDTLTKYLGPTAARAIVAQAESLSRPPRGELTGRQDPLVQSVGRYLTQVEDPREGKVKRLDVTTLERMALDPQIGAALEIVKLPILTVPGEIKHEDKTVETFLQERWNADRDRLMRNLLSALDFGWVVGERVYGSSDGAVIYSKLKAIHPSATELKTDDLGAFIGFKQTSGNTGSADLIPATKAFLYSYDVAFGNLYGRARTRRAYKPWWWSEMVYQFANRYMEDSAIAQRKVFYQPNFQPIDPENLAAGYRDLNQEGALRIAEEARAGAALAFPLQEVIGGSGERKLERGWDMEWLTQEKRGDEFIAYLDHLDLKKMRGMFVPEKLTNQAGAGATGSYSMLESLAELFMMQEEALLAELFAWAATEWAGPLIAYNFGSSVAGCEFVAPKLSQSNRQLLKDIFMAMLGDVMAGITPQLDIPAIAKEVGVPMLAKPVEQAPVAAQGGNTPQPLPDDLGVQASRARIARVRLASDIPGVRKVNHNRAWESDTALFQELVAGEYQGWMNKLARALAAVSADEREAVLAAAMPELRQAIAQVYRAELLGAFQTNYGESLSPNALTKLSGLLTDLENRVANNLLPELEKRLRNDVREMAENELLGAIQIRMGMVVKQSGGDYWQALEMGWIERRSEQEQQARAEGRLDELPRIRWRLDNEASHCPDCVAWAGEYDSIDELPAIPGDGSSACGPYCRCWLEVWNPDSNQWERKITDL